MLNFPQQLISTKYLIKNKMKKHFQYSMEDVNIFPNTELTEYLNKTLKVIF